MKLMLKVILILQKYNLMLNAMKSLYRSYEPFVQLNLGPIRYEKPVKLDDYVKKC